MNIPEKIRQIEEEIRETPYHKGTEHHIGKLRAKLAKLREQLLDLPGIIEQAALGRGQGRQILSVVRTADLLLIISEIGKEKEFKIIEKELLKIGLVVNNPTADKRIFQTIPALFVINKIDLMKPKIYLDNIYYLSIKKDLGLENLKEAIWQRLDFKRIYLKRKGEKADFKHPLIVKQNFTTKQIAEKVSSDLSEEIKSAKIWQGNAKYPGQEVGLNFKPADKTIVYLKS